MASTNCIKKDVILIETYVDMTEALNGFVPMIAVTAIDIVNGDVSPTSEGFQTLIAHLDDVKNLPESVREAINNVLHTEWYDAHYEPPNCYVPGRGWGRSPRFAIGKFQLESRPGWKEHGPDFYSPDEVTHWLRAPMVPQNSSLGRAYL